MDIKIRARLSAYAKISSIEQLNTELPLVTPDDAGAVIGVSDDGKYTLYSKIKQEQIDEMFLGDDVTQTVEKEEIDTLFDDKDITSVSKSDIDRLFDDSDVDNSMENNANDTSENKGDQIGVVSFSDIDSLFKK